MKSAVDKQERNCFFSSDDSCRLTASPLLIILCFRVCVCVCVACTDTELHSLAARLKDWFGVLHLDANRDLKSSDSFDSATGREYIPHTSVCVCVHACAHVYVQPFFCWAATLFSPHDGCRRCWQRPCSVQGIWTHLSSDTHTHTHTRTHAYIHTHTHIITQIKVTWTFSAASKVLTPAISFNLVFFFPLGLISPPDFDTSILPICKDSLGWMFNKLDMNFDLLLDQSELSAIYLDKYELCMKPLFNSCDSFKDGKLSNNEWCYCFQKPEGEEGKEAE